MSNSIKKPLATRLKAMGIGLFSLLLSGCEQSISVTLPFHLTYHNEIVDCQHFPESLSTLSIQLKDFRLYLHDIQLQTSDGDWRTLKLDQHTLWQNETTVLLDFENARGDCKLGNRGLNQQISGRIAADDYQAVRFKMGVPFELNHANPLIAAPPLNQSSMHWHWQAGYKFMRAEFVVNNQPRRLHLGSLHCKGEIGAISHCEIPNRPEFTLTHFVLNQAAINLSVDSLLDDTSLNDESYLTCMGGTEHPWCDNALKWLGLAGNKAQAAFSLLPINEEHKAHKAHLGKEKQ